MNCWEFMNCGRVPGGASAEALGVCPAFTCGAGQACWLVAGTMCGGQIQGTLARKIDSCLACDFFNQFGEQERSAARLRFGQIAMMTTILDTVGALVMVVDSKGRIVRFNRACEQITGYAFSEVRGRPIGEILLIPEEVQSVNAVFEELRTTGYPSRHESTLETKSGDRRLIAWANTLFANANGLETHFITTGIDITESRQIETKLQKSENWHRALVQTAMDGFWLVDTQEHLLEVNETYCRMSGYSEQELVGMPLSNIEAIEADDEISSHIEKIIAQGGDRFESRHRRKDGSVFDVEIRTQYRCDDGGKIVVFLRDISESKRLEKLSAVRMRLMDFAMTHSLTEHLQETLDEVESLTGSLVGFYHFFDEDQNQLLLQAWSTRTLSEFCSAQGVGLHYSLEKAGVWADCVRQHGPVIYNDYATLPHKRGLPEGHAPLYRLISVPIFREGRIVAVLGVGNKATDYTREDATMVAFLADVAWDLTERKRAEELRRQHEATIRDKQVELQALTAKLLSAKEEENRRLARELHDVFSQRLAVLSMDISALGQKPALRPDSLKKRLRRLQEEVGTMAQGIHQLSLELHPSMIADLGLSAALRAECAAFSHKHGIAAELVPSEAPDSLDSLPGEIAVNLYRIAQESLWNVAKHAQARKVWLTVSQGNGELFLAVEDDGTGFDPGPVKGKGSLGLVSMEERARLVNGRFSIQSQQGKGTRVEVRVPVPQRTSSTLE